MVCNERQMNEGYVDINKAFDCEASLTTLRKVFLSIDFEQLLFM